MPERNGLPPFGRQRTSAAALTIPTTGTFMLTEGERVDFNMYGNGVWGNGSFSFYSFSASLVGNASTNYQENRSDAMYSSDQQTGNTQDSINLQETGGSTISLLLGQGANYTLTVSHVETHWISQTLRSNGATTTASGSNNFTNVSTGTFSLAGGNPYLPPYQGANQAGGQGAGLMFPWASGNGGGTLGGNRVSPSFGLIDPRNVFPARSGNPVNGGLGLGGEQQGQSGNGNGQGDNGGGGQGGGGQGDGSSLGSQSSGGGGGYSLYGLNGTQGGPVGQLQPPQLGPDPRQYNYASMRPCNCGSGYVPVVGGGIGANKPVATTDSGGKPVALPPGTPLPPTPGPGGVWGVIRTINNVDQGFLNHVTRDWWGRGLDKIGLDEFTDRNSKAFKYGGYAGMAYEAAWAFTPCGAAARTVFFGGQAIASGANAAENIASGVQNLSNGDYGGAAGAFLNAGLDVADAYMGARMGLGACFAAGTPLLTPSGHKRIEDFQVGDLILSRSEFDPQGPVVAKRVEAVFVRTARILHLHLAGQVIRTTAEHPFFVHERGWVPAAALAIGDAIVALDGRSLPVEEVFDTGEYEAVYNLPIADFHTYFVGSEAWGFALWAHNPLSCGEHARILRDNLIKAGKRALAYAAHVVPSGTAWAMRSKQIREAIGNVQKILKDVGINCDQAVNGFFTTSRRDI